ncbi:helix-turn-helix domain-containing protein [Odoribacter sp. OttesenSCG-928-L07]|nr:helix-turn-helix domain-containing protein [Odoribacter sp. OttesenSCG-928-L07]
MISRIIRIMEDKNLSATQLANEIEIQRSTLSHILTGRNKPSLDIIIKILNTYPEINSEWLIKGLGNMYNNLDNVSINPKQEHRDKQDSQIEYNVENSTKKKTIKEKEVSYKSEIEKIIILYKDGTYDTFVK